jgi:hypothetical protein
MSLEAHKLTFTSRYKDREYAIVRKLPSLNYCLREHTNCHLLLAESLNTRQYTDIDGYHVVGKFSGSKTKDDLVFEEEGISTS